MDLQSLFSIISCSVLVLIGTGIAILASFRVHKANQIFCAGLFELDPSLAEFLRLVFEYIVLGIAMGMIAYGGVELTARANPERWIEGVVDWNSTICEDGVAIQKMMAKWGDEVVKDTLRTKCGGH